VRGERDRRGPAQRGRGVGPDAVEQLVRRPQPVVERGDQALLTLQAMLSVVPDDRLRIIDPAERTDFLFLLNDGTAGLQPQKRRSLSRWSNQAFTHS